MRTNTQEAVLSAYVVSIGRRTPRDAAQDAAELCRLANSLNRLNEIACNSGLTERQERRKQNLQTRIKAVLERGLSPQPLQQRSARLCRVPRSSRWLLQQLRRTGRRNSEFTGITSA
jgi:hypothetical protein